MYLSKAFDFLEFAGANSLIDVDNVNTDVGKEAILSNSWG